MLGSSALLASLLVPRAPLAAAQAAAGPARVERRAPTGRSPTACRTTSTATGAATPTRPGRSMYNANMLLTHAAAALAGHTGPARQRRAGAQAHHRAVRGQGVA